MPPSTTSSQTTSASPSPVWGRASTEFSILTASAGRSAVAASVAATPVSGQVTGGGGGGERADVVVGAVSATGTGSAADAQPEDVATARSSTTTVRGPREW